MKANSLEVCPKLLAGEKIFLLKNKFDQINIPLEQGCELITRALPDSYFFPFEDDSLDKILVLNHIPEVRMDQLYMVISEAKRALKPRGLLFIQNPTMGLSKINDLLQAKILGKRLLKIHHYFTPEDWKEVDYHREKIGWETYESILLQKI